MADMELALTGGDVLLADGTLTEANIGISDGLIASMTSDRIAAGETLDVSGLTILPGLIDEHFHVFRNYGWETYEGATRAAAKGGITTVVDMPLDNPPVLTEAAFREKLDAIGGSCHVDFSLFAGDPEGALEELDGMVAAGARALKIFTGGVAPPGMYPGPESGGILAQLRHAAALETVAVVHCENAEIVDAETARLQAEGRDDVAAWDEARPWYSELEAVARVALLAEVTGCKTVMAHLSSHQSVDAVTAARARGADVWVETCPHYLCLTGEDMAGDARMKWNPPSRDRASVERLWEQVAAGEIHTVGSDHAPLPKVEGANIWEQLPGAGNGLEPMLPLIATETRRRGLGLGRAVELLATVPAQLFDLHPAKGSLAPGTDADIVVVDARATRTLDARELEYHEQEKWSPYDGREVDVWPVYTLLRGQVVFAEGEVRGSPGDGRFLPGRRVA